MRLHDAFLRRLARHPEAEGFVLRGGMRVRELAPGARRTALDLDLACRMPFELAATERRIREILAIPLGDGLAFERMDVAWHPDTTGLRVVVRAGDLRLPVDVRFGLPLWPPPTRSATGWGARPETLVARKLHVIARLGRGGWRPKDLADIAALVRAGLDRRALGAAIEATGDPSELREVLTPTWWSGRAMEARWGGDLAATVGEVRAGVLG